MQITSYFYTMYYLLMTEYIIFKQTIFNKFIDLGIWIFTMVPITIYLFPAFGMQVSYGAFMIASMAASAGIFEQFTSTTRLVSDFDGDNVTAFYLTLPIPSWLVFASYMVFYAFNTAVLTIWVVPVSKLIFWNYLDLSQFSVIKYFVIFVAADLFYAAFTMWLVSMVPSLERIGTVWMRFIYPLWKFGAFQYSFAVLADLNPTLAYVSLINPFVYIMEGTRAAVLGQATSLNVWLCAGMTLVFTGICAVHAIARLKKRLDYV